MIQGPRQILDSQLNKPPSERILHRSIESSIPAQGQGKHLFQSPGIILCLKAKGRYYIVQNGKTTRVVLNRGEALYVAPGSWVGNSPFKPYQSLGIVFHPNLTRFYHVHFTHRDMKKQRLASDRKKRFDFSVPVTLDATGREICTELNTLPHERPPYASTSPSHLIELLLIKARSMLDIETKESTNFRWQAVCRYLEDNFHHPLTRADLAEALRVHPNHISRLFSKYGKTSFPNHLLKIRLERAKQLLKDPTLNVTEIAQLCGFSNESYFILNFRKHYGITPGNARSLS